MEEDISRESKRDKMRKINAENKKKNENIAIYS